MTNRKVGIHAESMQLIPQYPAGPKDQSSTMKLALTTSNQLGKHYTEDRFPQTFSSSLLSDNLLRKS